MLRSDGEIWIYYIGCRFPSNAFSRERHTRNKELYRLNIDPALFDDQVTICLAKLRPDGFVSLDADNAGTIFTKPFLWHGEDLFVNVDAAWGEFYASVVDAETLKVVPEFDPATQEPSPLKGDHWKAQIRWNTDRAIVFAKPVRLRFFMHQTRLYSFWLE